MTSAALKSGTAKAAYASDEERRRPVANLSLHAKQMQVFKSKARFRVVVAGRRWGKTELSKTAIITEARKRKRLIWYVAPTYQMARQIMWANLLESIPRPWIKKYNETLMTIYLVNGTCIQCKGADKPDTLRGVGLHFVVLDEFQDMREETWSQVIRPTLSSTRGRAVIIGTPKSFNHLYDLYMLGQKAEYVKLRFWQSWQFPTITSPFIPPDEIEAARNDMDEKSFRQEYEACHLPATEVRLWGGGRRRIDALGPGAHLVWLDVGGVQRPCEIIDLGPTGTKELIEVELETGEIVTASRTHKFKVSPHV